MTRLFLTSSLAAFTLFILGGCSEIHKLRGTSTDDAQQKALNVSAKKDLPSSERSVEIVARQVGPLGEQLSGKGLKLGNAVFLQIFKREGEVKVWMEPEKGQAYKLFKTYPICNFSGDLGPKLKEGDKQSPEGFYNVSPGAMNPFSNYHLSFNLGFPNAFDRSLGRTGSYLMVHGNCVSVGCYAMGDDQIEEIYTLAEAALKGGQKSFEVHAFPFDMTEENLAEHKYSRWYHFWKNLKDGYDAFDETKRPPKVKVASKAYKVEKQQSEKKDILTVLEETDKKATPPLQNQKQAKAEPEISTFKDGRYTKEPSVDDVGEDKAADEWDRIMMDERVLSSEDEDMKSGN
jgi:murein L,D-transpeptidase YafK